MGFSVTAAGIIVIMVLIIAVVCSVTVMFQAFSQITNSIRAVGEIVCRKIESYMTIKNATIAPDNQSLYIKFSNNGTLDYYDFKSFDLIVRYTDLATGSVRVVDLKYSVNWWITNVTVNGGYTYTFQAGDSIDPSESAWIKAVLPTPANVSKPIMITLVNQYGGRAVYEFVG